MPPAEIKKFIAEAKKRAEEAARKWHSSSNIKTSAKTEPAKKEGK